MPGDPSPVRGRLPHLEKYDLIEEIGHGGMATVYRAHDPRLGRDVAIKIIHPHLRESKEVAHRFAVEAKAVAKLRHPNIVEVYDVSEQGDRDQYLVVELLHGRTLRKILQERGTMPPEAAAALGLELLGALAHAHEQGIVHRDIKPENVIVEHPALSGASAPASTKRSALKVKLMDFGIAKLLDAQGVTSTGQVLGSPAHMAPEQIEGADIDGRADVFALGVLLYECMVGHLPFEGANPAQVLRRVLDGIYTPAEQEEPRVGKSLSVLLDRALAHRPEDRFAGAPEMREALEAELARVGVTEARAELDAWCANPDGYADAHAARMIAKLTALGHEARKKEDVLGAAAAFNRALAYAPHDRALLEIVSGMHKSQARARMLKRVAPLALAVVVAGTVAFAVTRAIKPAEGGGPVTAGSSGPAIASAPPSSVVPSATASATVAPTVSATAPATHPTFVRIPGTAATASATRVVTVTRLFPVAGVLASIDGAPPERLSVGQQLSLDAREHRFDLTCVADLCEPATRTVAAGAKDDALGVELKIRPAILVVDGDPGKKYVIVERPEIAIQAGVPAAVSFPDGAEHAVTIKEIDTGATKPASLRATKTEPVHFP